MDMPNKARLEALHLVRSSTREDFVWFSPEPEECPQFKPNSRAAIDEADMFRQDLREPVRFYNDNPWHRLSLNAHVALNKAHRSIMHTAAYHDVQRFTALLHKLSPDKYINLDTMLDAGGYTMTSAMFTTLRNVPRLAQHHDKSVKMSESGAIARNSVGLPWLLAMPSINQLAGMKAVLTKDASPKKWTKIDTLLDPQEYRLQVSNSEELGLQYKSLMHAELPVDFTISRQHEPQPGQRVKDIPSHDYAPVIGCPITLINQAVHRLWEAKIDAIEEHELWARETDPRFIQRPYQSS
jgi:hypothetical protein